MPHACMILIIETLLTIRVIARVALFVCVYTALHTDVPVFGWLRLHGELGIH